MNEPELRTPVALFIFNRPETTEKVFAEIARVKPTRLLVVADGPRTKRQGEAQQCLAARAVIERVDWPCEVSTDYSDANLGCRRRVSTGLDWVFATVEEAIIIEDDCLPHPSFFQFCQELLYRYRCDERVMHISGDNFQFGKRRGPASYYFSRYPHVWGWASWQRAWQHYGVTMQQWASATDKDLFLRQFTDPLEKRFWRQVWDGVGNGSIDSWAYQWAFACMARGALSIVPNDPLVSNIGFGMDSTHTRGESPVGHIPLTAMSFPLGHPSAVERDEEADEYTARLFFTSPEIAPQVKRALMRANRIVRRILGWSFSRRSGQSR